MDSAHCGTSSGTVKGSNYHANRADWLSRRAVLRRREEHRRTCAGAEAEKAALHPGADPELRTDPGIISNCLD
jgi:hypothetical protein